jgi:hypothetical protein
MAHRRNKAKAVKYTENEALEIIKQKKKEFYETQRAYRIKFKQRLLKQLELEEMRVQEESGESNIKMQWYGMPMPLKILQASYNLGLESYVTLINEEREMKDMLVNKYKLTEEQLEGVLDGKFVEESNEGSDTGDGTEPESQ